MLGFSQPASRHERREWWRVQIARQQSGNRSITEFCNRLGVGQSESHCGRTCSPANGRETPGGRRWAGSDMALLALTMISRSRLPWRAFSPKVPDSRVSNHPETKILEGQSTSLSPMCV